MGWTKIRCAVLVDNKEYTFDILPDLFERVSLDVVGNLVKLLADELAAAAEAEKRVTPPAAS